jgi:hypothetical protein
VKRIQAAHRVRAVDGKLWRSNTCPRNEALVLIKKVGNELEDVALKKCAEGNMAAATKSVMDRTEKLLK